MNEDLRVQTKAFAIRVIKIFRLFRDFRGEFY